MKKRLRLSILLWVLGVLAISQFASASAVNAVRTESRIYLNDQSVSIAGYNINGNNYFKLRDLANALKDTASCFDVTWNEAANQVELITQQAYTGGASEYGWSAGSPVQAVPSTAQLMVDGKLTDIVAYNINGNNYYNISCGIWPNGSPITSSGLRKKTASASTPEWGNTLSLPRAAAAPGGS